MDDPLNIYFTFYDEEEVAMRHVIKVRFVIQLIFRVIISQFLKYCDYK